MKIFGSCEIYLFYSERCNQVEENICFIKYVKFSYVVGLKVINKKYI